MQFFEILGKFGEGKLKLQGINLGQDKYLRGRTSKYIEVEV